MMQLDSANVILGRGHLYKFKSLTGGGFQHVFEILADNKIFFPRPSQLNDPEECKPRITVGNISDPGYWPSVEDWVRRCVAHRVPPPSENEIQAELFQLTQVKLESMMRQVDIEYRAAVENRYRILSLTDSATNIHLWKEYGGAFNGVCLEFLVNSRFGTALQVKYSDAYRNLDLTSRDDFQHLVMTGLVKRKKWSKEKEYRLIFGEPPIEDQPHLVNQKYEFPGENLTGLIIGCKVEAGQRDQLLALSLRRKQRLKCFVATPNPLWSAVRLQMLQ